MMLISTCDKCRQMKECFPVSNKHLCTDCAAAIMIQLTEFAAVRCTGMIEMYDRALHAACKKLNDLGKCPASENECRFPKCVDCGFAKHAPRNAGALHTAISCWFTLFVEVAERSQVKGAENVSATEQTVVEDLETA